MLLVAVMLFSSSDQPLEPSVVPTTEAQAPAAPQTSTVKTVKRPKCGRLVPVAHPIVGHGLQVRIVPPDLPPCSTLLR